MIKPSGGRSRARRQFSEINITPLTDIFLVLLIVMMVVSPLLEYQGLSVAVTTGSSAEVPEDVPEALIVSISAEGIAHINSRPVAWEELTASLREQSAAYPGGVVIETGPDTLHASLARALGAAQAAGIQRVALREVAGPGAEPVSP